MLAIRQSPRRAFVSLDHVGGLSPQPTNVVLLSDRSLHILQNFAITDIAQPDRYALGFANEYYWAVTPFDNADWLLYLELVETLHRELIPMTPYSYLEVRSKRASHTLSAGNNYKTLTPAESEGELIEVQAVGVMVSAGAPTRIELFHARGPGVGCLQVIATPPAAGQWSGWSGKVVCDDDSTISVNVYGAAAGSTLYIDMQGVQLAYDPT